MIGRLFSKAQRYEFQAKFEFDRIWSIRYLVGQAPGLTWGRILSTCVISMWSNDIKCKYMFVFPLQNSARKELSPHEIYMGWCCATSQQDSLMFIHPLWSFIVESAEKSPCRLPTGTHRPLESQRAPTENFTDGPGPWSCGPPKLGTQVSYRNPWKSMYVGTSTTEAPYAVHVYNMYCTVYNHFKVDIWLFFQAQPSTSRDTETVQTEVKS